MSAKRSSKAHGLEGKAVAKPGEGLTKQEHGKRGRGEEGSAKAKTEQELEKRGAGEEGRTNVGEKRKREIPKLREPVDITVLLAAVAWVVHLLLLRYHLSIPQAAVRAALAVQTAREYVHVKHPGAWFTAGYLSLALGLYPDQLTELTRRWLRKYAHRQAAVHEGERDWRLSFPWQVPEA